MLGLLALSFILVGLITVFALHHFLIDRLDQQLAAAGTRFSVGLEHPNDHDADDDDNQFGTVEGQAAGTLGARILNGRVTAAAVVGRGDTSTHVSQAARNVLASLTPTSHPQQIAVPGLGDYRVTAVPGQDGDILVTGLPEHPVNETIARLVLIELIVFGGALVVVGLVGGGLIRIALRPLDRIAATATSVARLPLGSGAVTLEDRVPAHAGESEIAAVSAAFNHMLEEVESALTQRQRSEDRLRHFVADASHELRTPVAIVRSHAEYAERVSAELDPEVSRSLNRIRGEADRMGRLVDDLLLLARLDSGRPLARDQVDLTRIVLDSVSDARIAAPGHAWRLALPAEPITVVGDEHALRQVVSNLLANARIHTPAGTHVATSLEDLGESVKVTVTDDGPGISPVLGNRIFERFVRGGDERNPGSSSSGLGLSIVSAIVAAHRGSVDVTSAPGSTTFWFCLPKQLVAAPQQLDTASS